MPMSMTTNSGKSGSRCKMEMEKEKEKETGAVPSWYRCASRTILYVVYTYVHIVI